MRQPDLNWHRHHGEPCQPYPIRRTLFAVLWTAVILGLSFIMLKV